MALRCCSMDDVILSSGVVTPAKLRKSLKQLGLSQSEAARRLYVEGSTLRRWLSGARKIPGPVVACFEAWEREQAARKALDKD